MKCRLNPKKGISFMLYDNSDIPVKCMSKICQSKSKGCNDKC